ncbi:GlcNAc-transferase family protein [Streptomyces sp. NPDC060035]|uniref:GlcNAc-transferase family protein n=1 Tax=Streptomyces sp. NPDC060035 TaxID=3347044 RepID=UPI00367E6A73
MRAPMRSAPRWLRFLRRGTAARTSSLARSNKDATSSRCADTSSSERTSAEEWVRCSVVTRALRSSACRGPAAGRARASVRYQSSSWSLRIAGKTWNICWAVSGADRQSRPS